MKIEKKFVVKRYFKLLFFYVGRFLVGGDFRYNYRLVCMEWLF